MNRHKQPYAGLGEARFDSKPMPAPPPSHPPISPNVISANGAAWPFRSGIAAATSGASAKALTEGAGQAGAWRADVTAMVAQLEDSKASAARKVALAAELNEQFANIRDFAAVEALAERCASKASVAALVGVLASGDASWLTLSLLRYVGYAPGAPALLCRGGVIPCALGLLRGGDDLTVRLALQLLELMLEEDAGRLEPYWAHQPHQRAPTAALHGLLDAGGFDALLRVCCDRQRLPLLMAADRDLAARLLAVCATTGKGAAALGRSGGAQQARGLAAVLRQIKGPGAGDAVAMACGYSPAA